MDLETFTRVHVVISVVAIVAGFAVSFGLITGRALGGWTALYLATTVATSVTGFFFPFERLTPAHAFGVISLAVLAVAIYALYVKHLAGGWRRAYVVSALFAFYLNFFVLVAQAFQKIPFLHELAPTQADPPFAIAQGITLVAFLAVGWMSMKRTREKPVAVSG